MKPREELWSKAADTRKSHDNDNMKDVVRWDYTHYLEHTFYQPQSTYAI